MNIYNVRVRADGSLQSLGHVGYVLTSIQSHVEQELILDMEQTRKVKCDEGHPSCGVCLFLTAVLMHVLTALKQCVRLGHMCDYNPRLAFRDDTQRIVERMHDPASKDDTVWGGMRLLSLRHRNQTNHV